MLGNFRNRSLLLKRCLLSENLTVKLVCPLFLQGARGSFGRAGKPGSPGLPVNDNFITVFFRHAALFKMLVMVIKVLFCFGIFRVGKVLTVTLVDREKTDQWLEQLKFLIIKTVLK